MSGMPSTGFRFLTAALGLAWAACLCGVTPAVAQTTPRTLYVDQKINAPTCTTYSPTARSCSGGRDLAFNSLAGVANRTEPGDTVLIREGEYHEPLVPGRSGTADQPITFKAYTGETATISNLDVPGIQIINREHLVIEGLAVNDTLGWGRLQDARENTIQHMTFARAIAPGTTGGLKIVRSVFNRILENQFGDGNDDVMVQDASDGNVIARNLFVGARHTLLCIKCSSGNIVRQNVFANDHQKAMEVFDCEGGSDAPFRLDATKGNIVEENFFLISRGSSRPYNYNGIQHGGQYTIVRRNVFLKDLGGGVSFQSYASEMLFVYGNRLYHNTFYDNRCFAVSGYSGDPKQFGDNRVVNNIFYENHDCDGGGDQLSIADSKAVILSSNAMEAKDPGFVDDQKPDLRLKPDSPMIDRAGPLTTTGDAGQGTVMRVKDVFWFSDGRAIPGEAGDEIQLLGTSDSARIVKIDYKASTLTLDRPLSWRLGQGVALKFEGIAPDFGAVEYGAEPFTNKLPKAPRQ